MTTPQSTEPYNEPMPDAPRQAARGLSGVEIPGCGAESSVDSPQPTAPLAQAAPQPIPAQDIGDDLRRIRERLDALDVATERKDEIIKNLHDELQSYKNGIRREYIYPILRDIIRWEGRATDVHSHYSRKFDEDSANTLAYIPRLLGEYKNLALGLRDLIDDHGLVAIEPAVGEKFDPRKHKKTAIQKIGDPAKEGSISHLVGIGFADLETGRLLKQAEVAVFSTQGQTSEP